MKSAHVLKLIEFYKKANHRFLFLLKTARSRTIMGMDKECIKMKKKVMLVTGKYICI